RSAQRMRVYARKAPPNSKRPLNGYVPRFLQVAEQTARISSPRKGGGPYTFALNDQWRCPSRVTQDPPPVRTETAGFPSIQDGHRPAPSQAPGAGLLLPQQP